MWKFSCYDGSTINSQYIIGDVVKIKDFGYTYPTYTDAFEALNIDRELYYNESNPKFSRLKTFTSDELRTYRNDNFVIIDICVHCRGQLLYLVRHPQTNIYFVCDKNAIKMNKNIPKEITKSLRDKNNNKILIRLI